jgi:hypothetical protein
MKRKEAVDRFCPLLIMTATAVPVATAASVTTRTVVTAHDSKPWRAPFVLERQQ